jgi:hypothetical protein
VAAHDGNRCLGTGDPQAFPQVMQVPIMERIVFGNQPDSPHN